MNGSQTKQTKKQTNTQERRSAQPRMCCPALHLLPAPTGIVALFRSGIISTKMKSNQMKARNLFEGF
jgi:hypothetical protein